MASQDPSPGSSAACSYRGIVVSAYGDALGIPQEDFTETFARAAESTLIAHAPDDTAAAAQAGITEDALAHDATTVDATDQLPLIVIATSVCAEGFFYFARPVDGWPRPGRRVNPMASARREESL